MSPQLATILRQHTQGIELNAAQLEAIANADAYVSNADLPTYSDLLAALLAGAPWQHVIDNAAESEAFTNSQEC